MGAVSKMAQTRIENNIKEKAGPYRMVWCSVFLKYREEIT